MAVKFSNNGKTTLSSGITTSATSLTVADGSLLPAITGSESFFLTLEDTSGNVEIVKVTARSGNSLTVTRAQESTTARAFSAGDKAENRLTAAGLNSFVSDSGDTMTGDLSFGDNLKTTYGADDDLEIYHDGTNSYVDHTKVPFGFGAVPSLRLKGRQVEIVNNESGSDNEVMVRAGVASSATRVQLFANGSERLKTADPATSGYGVKITGKLVGNGDAQFFGDVTIEDNNNLSIGSGSDTQIYHDGNNSKISHTGTGGLYVGADTFALQNGTHDENFIVMADNGAVTLYYDNAAKIATTSTGVDVTGAITADGMTIDGGDVTVNGEYADNVFMVDYDTGRVGVNLGSGNTPSNTFHVSGTVQFSGSGSNSGYQTTVTTYASSTTFYRANGDLSFHAGSSSYPKLTLTNSGTLTYDSQSVGTQSIVTTAPTSATGFPNGHVWYVVS